MYFVVDFTVVQGSTFHLLKEAELKSQSIAEWIAGRLSNKCLPEDPANLEKLINFSVAPLPTFMYTTTNLFTQALYGGTRSLRWHKWCKLF